MYEMPVATDRAERPSAPRSDASVRRCIVSGDALPREALIRFVVGPDDTVVPDLSERLPGRGLWLTGHRDIVAQACAKNAFRRAARRTVTPLTGPNGESLADLVEAQLAQRCLDSLGLARRMGQVIVGFDQVRAALKGMVDAAGHARGSAVLLTAQDAAADGQGKLKALADRVSECGMTVTQLALFDAVTLGKAIGRDQIVHALVETKAAGEPLLRSMRRLEMYRGVSPLVNVGGAESVPANVVELD